MRRLPSKSTIFWVLMGLGTASALLLPTEWTTVGRRLWQWMTFLTQPTTAGARQVEQFVEQHTTPAISQAEAQALLAENEQLQRQIVQQRLTLDEWKKRLDEVAGLPGQGPDKNVGLIVAPVVAYDSNPRRETLLITVTVDEARVLSNLVQRGPQTPVWVVAAGGAAPDWDTDPRQRDMVNRGWVVGCVVDVQPRLARVQLTTDPAFHALVRAGKPARDGTTTFAPDDALLRGLGGGKMRIEQAVQNYYASGYVSVWLRTGASWPVDLVLGRIGAARVRDDSSQHFDLQVLPAGRVQQLSHVYVLINGL
jgi:hypothetical protein